MSSSSFMRKRLLCILCAVVCIRVSSCLSTNIFPCRGTPSSIALPFPWFCYPSDTGVELLGSNGSMELTLLGQLQPNGSFVYGFTVPLRNQGKASLLHEGRKICDFVAKSEEASCPVDLQAFDAAYSCSSDELSYIDDYFQWWEPKSITEDIFDETLKEFKRWAAHIVIIDNKIYTDRDPSLGSDDLLKLYKLLTSISRKVALPNVEFLLSLSDRPRMERSQIGGHILSPCGVGTSRDILIPSTRMITRILQGDDIMMAINNKPWEERKNKLYFRGSNTGHMDVKSASKIIFHDRGRVAKIVQGREDLFDVKITFSLHRWSVQTVHEAIRMNLGCNISLPNCGQSHFKSGEYKYVLNLDGVSAPFRTHQLLQSGATMLKTESPYFEYYYKMLVPNKHYILVPRVKKLVKIVEWLQHVDEKAKKIADEGFIFAAEHLRQENVLCWMVHTIGKIKEGLIYEPRLKKKMYLVNDGEMKKCM